MEAGETLLLLPSLAASGQKQVAVLLRLLILLRFGDGNGLAGVADLEAGKAPDEDVFTQLADLAGDQLADGDARFFHEWLIEQADLFVELGHLAFHDLFD